MIYDINIIIAHFTWRNKLRRIQREMEKHLIHYAGKADSKTPGIRFKYAVTNDTCEVGLNQNCVFAQNGKIKPCIDSVFEFDEIPGQFFTWNPEFSANAQTY